MPAIALSTKPNPIVVDVRDQPDRTRDGILPGALALDAAGVVARLVPGLPTSLRAATEDARWVLVSSNGATASAIAARLRDRGVQAISVDGGFRALTARASSDLSITPAASVGREFSRTLESFSAHGGAIA